MNSKKVISVIIISAAVVVSIGLTIFFNPFKSNIQIFSESLSVLVSKSQELTRKYQEEIGKWNLKKHDNLTMVNITDIYLSQFEELEKEARNLNVPKGNESIKNSFIRSLESEAASYEHFKKYLITGNRTEDELSNANLSLAYQYEKIYADFLLKNH
ncbi:MAG TPA: hypothetical protein VIP29_01700 [Nitrososphaeraceae archaeon]